MMTGFCVFCLMAGFVWGTFFPVMLWLVGLGMVLAFIQMYQDEKKKNSKKKGKRG